MNLISFYDKVAHLVGQGKSVDGDFSKDFDAVSQSNLLDKIKHSARQVQNMLGEQLSDKSGSKCFSM